jgi:hypothetical protein
MPKLVLIDTQDTTRLKAHLEYPKVTYGYQASLFDTKEHAGGR